MATGKASRAARSAATSEATRARIVEATLETIRVEGIVGASARAIARHGHFNQASIYYHFGSIHDAMLAAIQHMSQERLDRYEQRVAQVSSLGELVAVAAELHREDVANGNIHVLAQVLAGATGDDALAASVAEVVQPWVAVVGKAIQQALANSPLAAAMPVDDLAYAVSALFIGVEMLSTVGPEDRSSSIFAAFEGIAGLVEAVLQADAVIVPSLPSPLANVDRASS